MAEQQRIVGIDLGTTNSLIAFMQGDAPAVIPGEDGSPIVPSVVAFDQDTANGFSVGNAARGVLLTNAANAVYSIKRLMGRDLADVEPELKLFPFHLAEGLEAGQVLKLNVGGLTLTPPRNLRLHPPPAQAQRRALLRRRGRQGRHHRACLLQ